MSRFLKICFILILNASGMLAQDAQFTQFYAAPLYLSPSFAGATDGSRLVLNFRDQWPKIPGAFITYAFSADHYIRKLKSGVGLLFMKDQAGVSKLSTTNIGWQYSFNVRVNKTWYFRPGIHFLYTQRNIDYTNNTFVDQISLYGISNTTIETISNTKAGFLDFGSSFLFYSRKHWFGTTVDHLLKSNQSFLGVESNTPIKYSFFGGKKFDINKRMGRFNEESLTLSMLFKKQRNFKQIDVGAYWYKAPIILGIWYRGIPFIKDNSTGYRNNDAASFLLGYKTLTFAVGYSYDFTVSRLVGNTGGAHEISIIYEFNQGPKIKNNKKHNQVSCPKF
jgi:type IX secretion system PorP/SprF family membrane protein